MLEIVGSAAGEGYEDMNPLRTILAALLVGFLALPTQAAVISAPDVTGSVDVVGMMAKDFNFTAMSEVTITGTVASYMGGDLTPVWDFGWNMTADADPFIDGIFSFTNLTGATQTFNVLLNLPVFPAFSPGLKSGDLSFSFTDTNNSGAASVTNISWAGLIDGISAMTLFAGDTSCGGVGCGFSLGPITNGPLPHPAGVASTLGIQLSFDLSAGDTAIFDTRFEVAVVPVPAAVWLFGSALGLLGWMRRKTQ